MQRRYDDRPALASWAGRRMSRPLPTGKLPGAFNPAGWGGATFRPHSAPPA
ncbi:hypothetical protein RQM47_11325 [Rubrivirga sp. S365]|uniref:Uncharacterized protein n=1 Tax=Rubrivirga litoralis TaxID=3075598 RepID=A0ABU3BQN5_9BACT|nr:MULTISPECIES: hypothetical protein [unclassified Rubrivirga]MDT0631585.1 hypothetical protein [Rubrivirga sp. F394]MDT7857230.1 hypothetical protein [Rubrivirga sp. S365]